MLLSRILSIYHLTQLRYKNVTLVLFFNGLIAVFIEVKYSKSHAHKTGTCIVDALTLTNLIDLQVSPIAIHTLIN